MFYPTSFHCVRSSKSSHPRWTPTGLCGRRIRRWEGALHGFMGLWRVPSTRTASPECARWRCCQRRSAASAALQASGSPSPLSPPAESESSSPSYRQPQPQPLMGSMGSMGLPDSASDSDSDVACPAQRCQTRQTGPLRRSPGEQTPLRVHLCSRCQRASRCPCAARRAAQESPCLRLRLCRRRRRFRRNLCYTGIRRQPRICLPLSAAGCTRIHCLVFL
jgi:hypothetical protein